MNYYSFQEIHDTGSCVRYVQERLHLTVTNGRCKAAWRGGTHDNVAVTDKEWYDHKAKTGGDLLRLCAIAEFGGDDGMAKQQAQEVLGNWLGLTPKHQSIRLPYDYRKQSTRYKQLVDKGYNETCKYTYTDEHGTPAHIVLRMEHPTERKEFIQCTPYQGSLHGVKTFLYNLPAILASPWAIVVEGEKDADTLIRLGLPATTCNNGADKWQDSYTEALRGKDVIICRDNDDAGDDHAHLLLRSLARAASRLRVICPSSQPKGDVTDWIEKEGGTREKLYKLMENARVISPEEAMWSDEALAVYRAKKANEKAFSNTVIDTKTVGGKEKQYDRPRSIIELIDDVHERLLGFPYKIGDRTMFDHDRDTDRIEMLETKDVVISWIGEKTKKNVMWKDVCGAVSKSELFSGLVRNARRFERVSSVPDFPKRSDVYYTYRNAIHPTKEHAAFEEFMRFFNPQDESSRILLRTLFAAPMYYKHGIQRPCWIIDSKSGQSVGKTTICELLAYLYKCAPIKTSKSELERDFKELLKRIVSTSGRNSRILMVDNVKGEFDDEHFSDLVTGFGISGKAPYGRGEETRPNDLTYIVTSNSANIGSDMASRSFILYIAPPKTRDKDWKKRVMTYIDEHRYEILGDIYDILKSNVVPADFHAQTRVPEFEADVLFPMAGSVAAHEFVMGDLKKSRDEANVDEDRAIRVVEIIKNELRTLLKEEPDTHVVFIRSNLVEYWMNSLNDLNVRVQDIRNMANTGRITCIDQNIRRYPESSRSNLRASGVMFYGDNIPLFGTLQIAIYGMLKKGFGSLIGAVQDEKITKEMTARHERREHEAQLLKTVTGQSTSPLATPVLPAPPPPSDPDDDYPTDPEIGDF